MTAKPGLPPAHLLLALAVMAVWGTNFVVIKVALTQLPPLLLAALRYLFVAFPLVFFLPRPKVRWRNLAAYGVAIGVGQFGLMFIALQRDITPGLASLVVQVQVFFTIGLSMWLNGEKVRIYQGVSLLLACGGLTIIATHSNGSATPLGLALVICAAFFWACGNTLSRAAGSVDMLAYVVWASLFAVPPLFGLALAFEGLPAIVAGVQHAGFATWSAVLWQSVGNTMFGYAAWGWLLARHPAGSVAPLALLVPVFGMGASAILLGEPLQNWKLLAAILVMTGLVLGIAWPRTRREIA